MIDTQLQQPPNRRLQRTALRAHEIVAFLKARISLIAFSIYWCGAAKRQHVGRQHIIADTTLAL
jgi:hypothetical protein